MRPTLGRALTLAATLPFNRPPVRLLCDRTSVTGVIYSAPSDKPKVTLFTKAGCTLCDVAKDVLKTTAEDRPHTLEAVDITDPEHAEWWDKYKYDIPVLHVEGKYWAKHRITGEAALEALTAAEEKRFEAQRGEPDAGRLERKG